MGAPIVHFELGGKDAVKLAGFYAQLLGWSTTDYGPSRMIDTQTDVGIKGHISTTEHEPPNYCVVYAMVEDLKATIAKAVDMGGQQVIPPTEVPGMGHFAWIKDPQGNLFGLWKAMAR